MSRTTPAGARFYHQDALGSTVNLTDSQTGAVESSYSLDPWGMLRDPIEPGDDNRQIFTGQEHDLNTGLIYFGARYYDPDIGRFITQDPYLGEMGTPQSLHRYMYANSNPMVYVDLDGRWALIDDGLAALFGGTFNLGFNLYKGTIVTDSVMESLGRGFAAFGAGAVAGNAALYGPVGWVSGGATVGGTNSWLAGENVAIGTFEGALKGLAFGSFSSALNVGMGSTNSLINYGSRTVLAGMSGYGVYTGGGHVKEGVQEGDWKKVALGTFEVGTSIVGLNAALTAGRVPSQLARRTAQAKNAVRSATKAVFNGKGGRLNPLNYKMEGFGSLGGQPTYRPRGGAPPKGWRQ